MLAAQVIAALPPAVMRCQSACARQRSAGSRQCMCVCARGRSIGNGLCVCACACGRNVGYGLAPPLCVPPVRFGAGDVGAARQGLSGEAAPPVAPLPVVATDTMRRFLLYHYNGLEDPGRRPVCVAVRVAQIDDSSGSGKNGATGLAVSWCNSPRSR
jgi:hypothetical protein